MDKKTRNKASTLKQVLLQSIQTFPPPQEFPEDHPERAQIMLKVAFYQGGLEVLAILEGEKPMPIYIGEPTIDQAIEELEDVDTEEKQ